MDKPFLAYPLVKLLGIFAKFSQKTTACSASLRLATISQIET
ncbi:hypothetical protein X781_12060 [Mannheimia sp. USDA-ARS-USMARC-1261]|nr:hypothetical protein X781_12060 [Mannheimia sp. USDA-ARS-USMARC-1261]